jgi:UDP-N-acetylglucosamine kinase
MTEKEKQVEQEAVRWIRRAANKRLIIEKFASPDVYKPSLTPMLIFTAGSPGAGKTEFIKGFREAIESVVLTKVVVIDPDAIRDFLPGYNGANSYLFQRAVSIAVDDLFRHILKNKQSAFIDGTLADYKRAHQNIQTAIEHYGDIMVCYVFQHPAIAWRFTELREAVEGRNIKKSDFVEKFLGAKETVDKIKADFGEKVKLYVILKDYKDTKENKAVAQVFSNAKRIEDCLEFEYTKTSIERILK